MFGSSGLDEKPDGCVTDNYLCRAEDDFEANHLIKSICNPRRILGFADPHRPYYKRGYVNVDEDGALLVGPVSDNVKYKHICVNHYFTKSKAEYIEKISRGKADSTNFRDMGDFTKHDKNDVYDDEIIRWKRRLGEHDGKGRETI